MPILSGVTAYLMSWVTFKMQAKVTGNPLPATADSKMMKYMMPLMSVWFCFMFPAGVGIYWIISNVFGIAQEYVLGLFFIRKARKEEAAREEKRLKRERRKAREAEEQRQAALEAKNSAKKPAKKTTASEKNTEVKADKAAGADGEESAKEVNVNE